MTFSHQFIYSPVVCRILDRCIQISIQFLVLFGSGLMQKTIVNCQCRSESFLTETFLVHCTQGVL